MSEDNKCCETCKHWTVGLAQEPCVSCDDESSNWQDPSKQDVTINPCMEIPAPRVLPKALDTQVGGGHYKDMVIQPVEFIVKNKIEYREANIIKYITRHGNKNGIEDVRKAMHYCQMIIDDYVEGKL